MTWVAPEARTLVSSGVKSACCTSVEMSTTGIFPRSFKNCTNMSWPPLPKALFTQISAIFSALRSSSSQRTCLAIPVSWVNEVRKMLSLPFWVMMTDSEPVNCGTPAWRAMSMLATVLELYTVPKIAKGLSLSTRRMTATEVGGSVWVSCTDVSSFMPRMPPFLLMSSTARLTASRHIAPTLAPPPVISATIGSLMTPCGLAGETAASTRSAASSESFGRADRMGKILPYLIRASAGGAPAPRRPAARTTTRLARDPEGRGLPARIVGGVEPVADATQEPARTGLGPEPPRDFLAAGGRLHRQVTLEIERLEIVGAVADEVGERQLRRPLGHVGVPPVGELLEEAHHPAESRGRNSAEPEKRAAAARLEPALVIAAHLRGLHRDVPGRRVRRLDARRLRRRARLVAGLRVIREVTQDRPGRLGQEVEGGPQHAMLQLRIFGPPERVAERERHPERARRLHLLGVLTHQADRRRGDARGFEDARQHTAGVRAVRSRRGDERRVHAVGHEPPGHFGTGLALDAHDLALGAHERVVARPEPAELAPRDQLAQTVDRERDVDVPHDRNAVEADARVALEDVRRGRAGRNDAIRLVARREEPVAADVDAGRGHDGQPARGERLRRMPEGRGVVDLRRERQQVVPRDLRQTVESWHYGPGAPYCPSADAQSRRRALRLRPARPGVTLSPVIPEARNEHPPHVDAGLVRAHAHGRHPHAERRPQLAGRQRRSSSSRRRRRPRARPARGALDPRAPRPRAGARSGRPVDHDLSAEDRAAHRRAPARAPPRRADRRRRLRSEPRPRGLHRRPGAGRLHRARRGRADLPRPGAGARAGQRSRRRRRALVPDGRHLPPQSGSSRSRPRRRRDQAAES